MIGGIIILSVKALKPIPTEKLSMETENANKRILSNEFIWVTLSLFRSLYITNARYNKIIVIIILGLIFITDKIWLPKNKPIKGIIKCIILTTMGININLFLDKWVVPMESAMEKASIESATPIKKILNKRSPS